MGRRKATRRARPARSEAEVRRDEVVEKAAAIGVPLEQLRQGQYEVVDVKLAEGERAKSYRTLINRGGSTITRWLNAPSDDHIGDAEKAAIHYCMALWQRLDRKGPRMIRVDNDDAGWSEHEALTELAGFKARIPSRYWQTFEDVCRWEVAARDRHTKVIVGFVAGMIALWRGLSTGPVDGGGARRRRWGPLTEVGPVDGGGAR